jgi:hypothetical protein
VRMCGSGGLRYRDMTGVSSSWEGSNERQSPRPFFTKGVCGQSRGAFSLCSNELRYAPFAGKVQTDRQVTGLPNRPGKVP